ncbi:MAG: hydratase [Albidovulum sp.]|uniref:2-keto-4-pentenoate hydratase n=1 Tax=Albidovulum sp. TaxID=1872424 RepID=UPI00132AB04E|nr:fumarylacetoacetate hydrolase family protein [Defluviimonas sp.]KAB2881722.1 MAG: hydratase [Defluviimonas sp.]
MQGEYDASRTAGALMELLGTGRQSADLPVPDMAAASRVIAAVRALREARGERVAGRKIGFSNRSIWPIYGVDRPMWNYVWDSTLIPATEGAARIALAAHPEPRVEPEIVLRLGRDPAPGMSEAELLGCVDAVAHGLEIVQSVFPGWRFTAAQSAAAFGLHGALVVGPWHEIGTERVRWGAALGDFTVTLRRDGARGETGHARNVLGGPVQALRFVVEAIAADPLAVPLRAGEIVSTGTLTDAAPAAPGQIWTTVFDGIGLGGLTVTCG